MDEINDIVKEINKFRDARNWRQFHNEKDLSLSITLEAAELLELFQWKTSDEVVETNRAVSYTHLTLPTIGSV